MRYNRAYRPYKEAAAPCAVLYHMRGAHGTAWGLCSREGQRNSRTLSVCVRSLKKVQLQRPGPV